MRTVGEGTVTNWALRLVLCCKLDDLVTVCRDFDNQSLSETNDIQECSQDFHEVGAQMK